MIINGPTTNHVLMHKEDHKSGPFWSTWWKARCGYNTRDADRIDNPAWADRPMCKRCERASVPEVQGGTKERAEGTEASQPHAYAGNLRRVLGMPQHPSASGGERE